MRSIAIIYMYCPEDPRLEILQKDTEYLTSLGCWSDPAHLMERIWRS